MHRKSSSLSEEERQYLLNRHGTLNLEPMPHANDNDPLNWPLRVKIIQLGMIAFHAFSTTFMAAGLIPSFATLLEEFLTTITACSYLTSAQIIVMGFFPLLWIPLMDKYGRRQILLLSTLISTAFNIGCVFSHTYRNLMICRIFHCHFSRYSSWGQRCKRSNLQPPAGMVDGMVGSRRYTRNTCWASHYGLCTI